ncbi:aconitase X catalytic domain-containing protein [Methanomicrobium antiquum]|uniref:Phosphomevalonate dehydratase large subunit n=1 Tax=Methanomicrobium antiquum TaxID=487686 RepID=A0AAF0FNH2_9EURY|nr:aconitase X catalytic domain-containing protein [Methanomicrobium antiquum]MDD3977481.1 aconitase X catalytic domain-containing protein [Methanomicrobium sp.]WFN37533.1 aconitase X catalytic domain-containing protein [Methanomicrobium antiquum]
MYLDSEDESILNGEYGETRQKMMEILLALGKVFNAENLVPITSAQISGASYKTIGEWGLEWLNNLDARVAVPSILNPIGMPRESWRDIGISTEFAENQNKVIKAYKRLGIKMECTCTPYYLNITNYGDHLAWSESSAVSYANSVIGARTNREGGPSALAAAMIGKTPNYGLHLFKNRMPEITIEVESGSGVHSGHYGAIGYLAGKIAGNKIPFLTNIRPSRDQLKALGAAMAASGAVALYHVKGITPETKLPTFKTEPVEKVVIEQSEIESLFEKSDVDAVAVGCPHCSPDELSRLASLLEGKKTTKTFFVFVAKGVKDSNMGYVSKIEKSGAKVVEDTCIVVSPAMDVFDTVMVDSGKAFAYVPNMCGCNVRIGTLEECVLAATS